MKALFKTIIIAVLLTIGVGTLEYCATLLSFADGLVSLVAIVICFVYVTLASYFLCNQFNGLRWPGKTVVFAVSTIVFLLAMTTLCGSVTSKKMLGRQLTDREMKLLLDSKIQFIYVRKDNLIYVHRSEAEHLTNILTAIMHTN